MVKNLNVADLQLQLGDSPGQLVAIAVDNGPKRIALILDASENVPDKEWKLVPKMAASFVGHARPDDQFLIVFVGKDSISEGEFLSPVAAQKRLEELVLHRPTAAGTGEKTYDALLAVARRLEPPAFGDALFLFGHPEDSGSKATADQVRQVLLRNQFRFYAVSFTDPLKKKLPPNFDLNQPLPATVKWRELTRVSEETGYFFSFHPVEQLEVPGQAALFENFLGDLYAGIAEPYRVTIAAPVSADAQLRITLPKAEELRIHGDGYTIRYTIPMSFIPATTLPSTPLPSTAREFFRR